VRGLTRLAEDQLIANKLEATPFLQALEDYASVFEIDAGGPGVALFRSPNSLAALAAPGTLDSNVTLSRYSNLAPLITLASVPRDFHILALNRKSLHLYHYKQGRCEHVDLPAGVAANMEAALDLDWPDHSLQNRSSSGNSTGAMHAVQFGTSSDREDAKEHLFHFFQLVDRGLKEFLKENPLLLAGVHEEVATYRRASHNPHLLELEIHGNVDFLTPAEIAARASKAAVEHYYRTGETVLEKYREMPNRKHACEGVQQVLSAALEGRVHQLCAAEATVVHGSLKKHGGFENEDLVNAAIVETLRHGGEVFMLPASSMPEGVPLAAILRF
jgi:hypothetical protein